MTYSRARRAGQIQWQRGMVHYLIRMKGSSMLLCPMIGGGRRACPHSCVEWERTWLSYNCNACRLGTLSRCPARRGWGVGLAYIA